MRNHVIIVYFSQYAKAKLVASAKEFGVCLSACLQINSKSCDRMLMKFPGNIDNGQRKRLLNFGGVLDFEGTLIFQRDKQPTFYYYLPLYIIYKSTGTN